MSTPLQILDSKNAQRIAVERQSQWLVSAFIITGVFFMLLPGTFLGVWNLLDISEAHLSSALPQAWLQAHGQAQIFGWIGSFIIGIGLYSLTKTQSTMIFPTRIGWSAWALWTLGIAMRWSAGIVLWQWRILLPVSGLLQLAGFLLFFYAVRRHGPKATGSKPEPWMRMVVASTICFLLTLVANFGLLLWQGIAGSSPALPHVIDQEFILLAVWGIVVPTDLGIQCPLAADLCGAQAGERQSASVGLWAERRRLSSSPSSTFWRWRRFSSSSRRWSRSTRSISGSAPSIHPNC